MILMYHKIHPNSPSMWWVTVNDFYRQMSEISKKEVVYLDDYDPKNPNHVVITFDGIYKNVLEYAMPVLKHFDYPFELFLTSDYIGQGNEFDTVEPNASFVTYEELTLLKLNKGRLQWHTKSHPNLKNVQDQDIIYKELTIPDNIKQLDPEGFTWFAYPYGEFNELIVQEVKKRFKGAVSCIQGNDEDVFILNRLTVVNDTILRDNKIACIIASYNYGDYLIEAVESVLRQTILPNEILISDDCSDDETQIIAKTYVAKYPELISYNRNDVNMGVVDHFNKAISLTKSEYVFFLGADNRILSNYIEESAKKLDQNVNVAIAYTDYAFFGSRAKLAYSNFPEDRKAGIVENTFYQICFPDFNDRNELVETLIKGNFIHGSSMFKRIAFDDVDGYIKTNTAEDYNLFRRVVEKGWTAEKVKNTNLEYRQHSVGQVNNLVSLHNRLNLYKKLYLEKNSFENSKFYKLAFSLFKIRKSSRKAILKKIIRKIIK
jgi:glycosyltransferase involved in cell wall biosynthesis